MCLHETEKPPRIEVADGHQDGVFRSKVTVMVVQCVLSGEPSNFANSAARVARQGMVAVDEAAKAHLGAEGRIFQVASIFSGDSLGDPAHRVGGENRPDRHVGEQFDRQGQIFTANAERAPGRAALERAPDIFDRFGQLGCGACLGPFLEQSSGQAGEARFGFAQQARVGEELEGDNARTRASLEDESQAVLEHDPPRLVVDEP